MLNVECSKPGEFGRAVGEWGVFGLTILDEVGAQGEAVRVWCLKSLACCARSRGGAQP